MPIPWLTRPPTAEEVAAHAKAYPVLECHGLWLYVPPRHAILGPRPARTVLLHTVSGAVLSDTGYELVDARWLPCTAEGIPLCFRDLALSEAG